MTTPNTEIEIAKSAQMGAFDQRDEGLVRYLGLDPRKPEDRAAVAVCRHYGFDPLLKHVVVIPRSGVYITRDGLLSVAHRSGQLDGILVVKDPVLEGDEWVAKVSVYRKDMKHAFTFPGRYPANGSNKLYGPEMALKAAEAHALRRAFDIGGLPTFEEQRPGDETPAAVTSVRAGGPGSARVTTDELTSPVDKALENARATMYKEPEPAMKLDGGGMEDDYEDGGSPMHEPADRSDEIAELFSTEADSEA